MKFQHKFNSLLPVSAMILLLGGLISTLLLPTPVSAQDATTAKANSLATLLNIPLCPDVFAVAPENPAFIGPNDSTRFAWSGEPGGATRRDFVAYDNFPQPDGSFLSSGNLIIEGANPLEHTTNIGAGNALPGTYNWMAVFYDGNNNAICRTNTYWLDVRGRGGSPDASSGAGGGSVTVVQTACGWVVVFTTNQAAGAPATFDQGFAGDTFTVAADSTSGDPTCNHEIHGNNNANDITGGTGNDQIFGYTGNDTLNGGEGNDTLNGGNESCTGNDCNSLGSLGDTLNGGEGNDELNGGDESCTGLVCNDSGSLGDTLNGDAGNDTLNGGNESCTGFVCNDSGSLGDTLNGGTDDDTLNGGNESCANVSCNNSGSLGDTLNGGEGNDELNGGDESCTGGTCNSLGSLGDTLNGDAGNDTLNGGDESCTAGVACNSSGSLGDDIDGGTETDEINGGTETEDDGVAGNQGANVGDTTCAGETVNDCP